MTGEITLTGKVLPVGGIKEKILAAKRENINTILLSIENERDIKEIEPQYLEGMEFNYYTNVDDVLKYAIG
jgi:ATP-dependent Lon protease